MQFQIKVKHKTTKGMTEKIDNHLENVRRLQYTHKRDKIIKKNIVYKMKHRLNKNDI